MRIAVTCHVYYFNIWDKFILPKLSRLKCDFDLYITLVGDGNFEKNKSKILSVYNNAVIDKVPNLGEDVRGFLRSVRSMSELGKKYDYVLKIHTKSENTWRETLLNTLIPVDYNIIEESLKKQYNFIVNGLYYKKYSKPIGINQEFLGTEKKLCGCDAYTTNHFSGTMFWVNYDVVERYFINSELKDTFFDDKYAKGGTKAHSFEILIGCINKETGDNVKELGPTNTKIVSKVHNAPKIIKKNRVSVENKTNNIKRPVATRNIGVCRLNRGVF